QQPQAGGAVAGAV
ncbi:hypothetical protein BN1708_020369, partial [Verticillium longisporum]